MKIKHMIAPILLAYLMLYFQSSIDSVSSSMDAMVFLSLWIFIIIIAVMFIVKLIKGEKLEDLQKFLYIGIFIITFSLFSPDIIAFFTGEMLEIFDI